jgi:hypothetical protein
MPTRKEILDQIKADPAGTLGDIELLRSELVREKLIADQLEKRLRIAEFMVGRYKAKLDEAEKLNRLMETIHTERRV